MYIILDRQTETRTVDKYTHGSKDRRTKKEKTVKTDGRTKEVYKIASKFHILSCVDVYNH